MSDIDPTVVAPAEASAARRPTTVVAGVALLAVSIGWWLVELPRAMAGIAGPGGVDALVLAVGALLSLPAILEVVAAVLVWRGHGWARYLLLPVVLYGLVRLVVALGELRASDLALVAIDAALVVGALVLLFLAPSRSWFALRRAARG
ncbi:hypothetical protein [Pseudactinotalea suaedae]|uniref:hypothetical protein n=1 Tax=Pseudactinotalea suaedae TaxID=1524924 RepID=UPI0012E2E17B|nr:hypothetical protein [Pseudactinotalea suaedae]